MSKYDMIIIVLLFLSNTLFGQNFKQQEIQSSYFESCNQELIKTNSKYGVRLVDGDTILPCNYDSILIETCSLHYVKKDSLWGVFKNQSQIVPIEYDAVMIRFRVINVRKGWYWGLYNHEGQKILPCKYSSFFIFNLGLAVIIENGKYGFIDTKGIVVIPMIYNDAFGFSEEGLAAVELDTNYGFIDTTGEFAIEPKYDFVQSFYKGYAWFRTDSSINNIFYNGLLDTKGNEIILNEFDNHHIYFSDSLLGVKKNQKWGFINFDKNVIIEYQYDDASEFIDGYAKVTKNGKTLYINTKGKEFVRGLRYHFIKNKFSKNYDAY